MRHGIQLAVLLLFASVFAGCVGGADDLDDGDDDNDPNGDPGDDGQDEGPVDPATQLRFDGPAFNATQSHSGTFAPHQTCPGVGCFTGESFPRIDITDIVPKGQPVSISAVLNHHTGATGSIHGDFYMNIWLETEDTTFYRYDWRNPEPGTVTLDIVILRHDGPTSVGLQAIFPPVDANANLDWQLEIETTALVDEVTAAIPLQIPVKEDQELVVQTVGGGDAKLLAYGPDDAYLGRFSIPGEATFDSDNQTGAFVFIPTTDSAPVTFSLSPADEERPPRLDPLGFDVRMGPAQEVAPQGETTWSFDVEDHPLRAGVVVVNQDDAFVAEGMDLTLQLPDGTGFEWTASCGGCASVAGNNFGAPTYSFSTPYGHDGLVPGTYQAGVTTNGTVGYLALEYTVHYAR